MNIKRAVLCLDCEEVYAGYTGCPQCASYASMLLANVLNRQGQALADARTEMAQEMAAGAPKFYTPLWQLDKDGGKA